jgi:hypothetical protein
MPFNFLAAKAYRIWWGNASWTGLSAGPKGLDSCPTRTTLVVKHVQASRVIGNVAM